MSKFGFRGSLTGPYGMRVAPGLGNELPQSGLLPNRRRETTLACSERRIERQFTPIPACVLSTFTHRLTVTLSCTPSAQYYKTLDMALCGGRIGICFMLFL